MENLYEMIKALEARVEALESAKRFVTTASEDPHPGDNGNAPNRLAFMKDEFFLPDLPKPFPVRLEDLYDPTFSDGLSPSGHLDRLYGHVSPPLSTEEAAKLIADEWRLAAKLLQQLSAAASAQPAAIAQPAEVDQLTPKEIEAQARGIPRSERLPDPDLHLKNGCCWLSRPELDMWFFSNPNRPFIDNWTHWMPYWKAPSAEDIERSEGQP